MEHGPLERVSSRKGRIDWLGILPAMCAAAMLVACANESDVETHLAKVEQLRLDNKPWQAIFEARSALSLAPDRADARLILGKLYLSMEDGRGAKKEFEAAQQLGVPQEQVAVFVAQAKLYAGQFEDVAAKTYGDDQGLSPAMLSRLHAHRGEALIALGRFEEARSAFNAADAHAKDTVYSLIGRARLDLMKGQTAAAAQKLDSALILEPDNAWALSNLGYFALQRGDGEAAEGAYRRALTTNPFRPSTLAGLIRAQLTQSKNEAALDTIKVYRGKWQAGKAITHLEALARVQNKQYEQAEALVQALVSVDREDVSALQLLAWIQTATGRPEQALKNWKIVYALRPNATDVARKLAHAYRVMKFPDKALEVLQASSSAKPTDTGLLSDLGRAHFARGDLGTAAQVVTQAVRLEPGSAAHRHQLAVTLLSSGKKVAAFEEVDAMLEIDPGSLQAYSLRIASHMNDREFADAFTLASQLAERHPNDPVARNLMGAAKDGLGETGAARKYYEQALTLAPTYDTAAMNLARLQVASGESGEAKATYTRLLNDPQSDYRVRAALNLVELARHAANRHAVEDLYRRILDVNANQLEALQELSKIHLARGRARRAAELLERARVSHPAAVEPRAVLARIRVGLGDLQSAMELADEIEALGPDKEAHLSLAAEVQRIARNIPSAVQKYEKLVALAPQNSDYHLKLGLMLTQKGNRQAAKEAITRALTIDPKLTEALATLAQIEMSSGNWAAAEKMLVRLESQAPDNSATHVLRADLATRRQQYSQAAINYEKAFIAQQSIPLAVKLVRALRAAGNPERGYQIVNEWRKDLPSDVSPTVLLAQILEADKHSDRAIELYQEALALTPENALVLNNLAWLKYREGAQYSVQLARKAHTLEPDVPEFADTFGWLLVETGQLEQGLRVLNTAAQKWPDFPTLRFHHALALAKRGDLKDARQELEQLIRSEAPFAERQRAQAILRNMPGADE